MPPGCYESQVWISKAFQELNLSMRRELYNCRAYHCFIDEDHIGTIKGLCKRVHRGLLEHRVLLRWTLRLRTFTQGAGSK